MAANIEVKVRVKDFVPIVVRLRAMGARHFTHLRQRDTYFDVDGYRLKLREESFRIASGRCGYRGRTATLIVYARPNTAGHRRSDYVLIPIEKAAATRATLGKKYGVLSVVDKVREYWRIDRTRVHLDRVRGLGTFLELETEAHPKARQECRRVLAALGLSRAQAIAGSYSDLLSARRRPPL